jgi:hypothetical protein
MMILENAPIELRTFGLAAGLGLAAGGFAALVPDFGGERQYEDDWSPFTSLNAVALASVQEILDSSPIWKQEKAVEVVDEPPDDTGLPGALAYLGVIAIVSEPEPSALMRVDKLPEKLREEFQIEPDQDGLVSVVQGDEVLRGWSVESISETVVTLSATGAQNADQPAQVQYRLFD